jgi:hypothetical protein
VDVVFLIDRSTSVQDDESGDVANGVALLAEFAACVVDELDSWDDNVGLDRIRVAAINFATKARLSSPSTATSRQMRTRMQVGFGIRARLTILWLR